MHKLPENIDFTLHRGNRNHRRDRISCYPLGFTLEIFDTRNAPFDEKTEVGPDDIVFFTSHDPDAQDRSHGFYFKLLPAKEGTDMNGWNATLFMCAAEVYLTRYLFVPSNGYDADFCPAWVFYIDDDIEYADDPAGAVKEMRRRGLNDLEPTLFLGNFSHN